MKRWRQAPAKVRAETIASAWEIFSVLLFISAVVPAAFASPWPSVVFVGGLALSVAIGGRLVRMGRRGFAWAAAIRTIAWLLAASPLLMMRGPEGYDVRLMVATLGFGLMAGMMRRSVYRRYLDDNAEANMSPVALRSDLRPQLADNAMVAGIVGGHVLLLFSVAFLRTASVVVFRAWWEIVPALAVLGTICFTYAVRPVTASVMSGLRRGPSGDRNALRQALEDAVAIPRRLSYVNFGVWVACITIGVLYFKPGPLAWNWPDALMQIAYGALFAWGVSFYQRGWHEDTLRPSVVRLREWTGHTIEASVISLRRRMLNEFGLPLLFTALLSLLSAIGLYRTLGHDLPLQEDFNAITALSTSFAMLVLAVGGVFMRAARLLSEPLSSLADAADQVASGKLDQNVPRVEGPVEVVGLGRSIEHMRRALARTIAELKEERASLETNVELRTAELREALDELKQAQTALIQGERMALIGELVAGIAHEVYNPLNAIGGSISSLERVRDELQTMLSAYEAAEAKLPAAERQALSTKRDELDIRGALDDLAGVVKVVQSATRRSVAIVGNLKRFARAPDEPIPSDLHEGLAETLSLLGHRIRQAGIDLREDYGDLPSVVCRVNEINQVFMNLLTNAIQAVGDSPVIRVQTALEEPGAGSGPGSAPGSGSGPLDLTAGTWAVIAVSDNGPGVPEKLKGRVFDPFFTTKARGEGTGLGLSISSQIVRRHGGTLTVETDAALGGAKFVCRLPVGREIQQQSTRRGRRALASDTRPTSIERIHGSGRGRAGAVKAVIPSSGRLSRVVTDSSHDLVRAEWGSSTVRGMCSSTASSP